MPIEYPTTASLRTRSANLGANLQKVLVEKAAARKSAHSTFLSHSTKDADILPAVIDILEKHGAAVYVDKKDPTLPPYTSRDTATALRSRINVSKKFILLASDNSKDSRWVPWELGLADGYKHPQNVAIFPSVEKQNDHRWTDHEYMGVYDRIVYGDHKEYNSKIWMVLNQEANTATELRAWLAR